FRNCCRHEEGKLREKTRAICFPRHTPPTQPCVTPARRQVSLTCCRKAGVTLPLATRGCPTSIRKRNTYRGWKANQATPSATPNNNNFANCSMAPTPRSCRSAAPQSYHIRVARQPPGLGVDARLSENHA